MVCRRTWSLARQTWCIYVYIYCHVTDENFLRKSIFKCVYVNVSCCFHLLAACPNTFIFTSTPVGETRTLRCSTLSDLLYSGIISARCGGDGEWESLDLSQCTFRELPNKLLLLKATETNISNNVSKAESLYS